MPDDVEALINQAAASMPAVQWATPAEIRSAAHAYRRRRVIVTAVAALVGVGGGLGILGSVGAVPLPSGHLAAQAVASCPDGLVPANVALPDADKVRLHIYNGTARSGLAVEVAQDLRLRDFQVLDAAESWERPDVVAVIRYGPKTVGAAWVMRSYFLDEAETEFNLHRDDDVVDIVLGVRFTSLATRTEVNRSIAALGRAQPPAGTCGVEQSVR